MVKDNYKRTSIIEYNESNLNVVASNEELVKAEFTIPLNLDFDPTTIMFFPKYVVHGSIDVQVIQSGYGILCSNYTTESSKLKINTSGFGDYTYGVGLWFTDITKDSIKVHLCTENTITTSKAGLYTPITIIAIE